MGGRAVGYYRIGRGVKEKQGHLSTLRENGMLIQMIKKLSRSKHFLISPAGELRRTASELIPDHVKIPTDGIDVWEIDPMLLKFDRKIVAGSYRDLSKGTFRNQDVAIKVLNAEYLTEEVRREFVQEVYILRFVTLYA
ncbi:glutathione transferase [Sarracenia purpurea var. burkii]